MRTQSAPPGPLQVGLSLGVLHFAGHLLGLPGVPQYPEAGTHPPQHPVPPLEVRGGGVEDAVLNIVGGRAAHGEPGEPVDDVYLSPHQMEDMGPHLVNPAAAPLLPRVGVQQIEVLVVPIHEQGGKRTILQPVQVVAVRLLPGPARCKVRSPSFPAVAENCVRSLAPRLRGKPVALGFTASKGAPYRILPLMR